MDKLTQPLRTAISRTLHSYSTNHITDTYPSQSRTNNALHYTQPDESRSVHVYKSSSGRELNNNAVWSLLRPRTRTSCCLETRRHIYMPSLAIHDQMAFHDLGLLRHTLDANVARPQTHILSELMAANSRSRFMEKWLAFSTERSFPTAFATITRSSRTTFGKFWNLINFI